MRPDGSAAAEPSAIEGAPKSLGTPNVVVFGQQALVMFSARGDKSEPYRIYVASAGPGKVVGPARALELPTEGGGAIAPSLAALPGERYLVQWTDGVVGQYQVHVRIFDSELKPQGEPLLVSAKGANAGQGTIVTTSKASVSFFIQTTAGHDELWGSSAIVSLKALSLVLALTAGLLAAHPECAERGGTRRVLFRRKTRFRQLLHRATRKAGRALGSAERARGSAQETSRKRSTSRPTPPTTVSKSASRKR